jgi:nickel superoxide dismutase
MGASAATVLSVAIRIAPSVKACEIPCGIYDDEMRINMIAEHITILRSLLKEFQTLYFEQK